jgi:hypothetical protein
VTTVFSPETSIPAQSPVIVLFVIVTLRPTVRIVRFDDRDIIPAMRLIKWESPSIRVPHKGNQKKQS